MYTNPGIKTHKQARTFLHGRGCVVRRTEPGEYVLEDKATRAEVCRVSVSDEYGLEVHDGDDLPEAEGRTFQFHVDVRLKRFGDEPEPIDWESRARRALDEINGDPWNTVEAEACPTSLQNAYLALTGREDEIGADDDE